MLILCLSVGIVFLRRSSLHSKPISDSIPSTFFDIDIHDLSGKTVDLRQFQGNIILVVNVASKCGFTPQYNDLEELYQRYKSRGLVIIGVPSNDFGGQEPGTAQDIQLFCRQTYGVTFPMTEKVTINGSSQHALYNFLTSSNKAYTGKVKWNFTKFLVDQDGHVIDRFSPMTNPLSNTVVDRIEQVLPTQ